MSDPLDAFDRPVDPETVFLNEQVELMLRELPPMQTQTVEQFRARVADMPHVRLDQARERTIAGPDGPVPIRVMVPEVVKGVYCYIHGGGWLGGSHDLSDVELWGIAERASVATVSVGYRLAPEHPYPAGPDDCEAVALWLAREAASEFGTDRIVIGGESAGAHLTAVTLLRLRDRHGIGHIAGAEMRYGMYDFRRTPTLRLTAQGALHDAEVQWIVGHFVSRDQIEDPDVSPLLASLHDLPPALFTVGSGDSLIDDTLFMWARWRAAGNPADLRIYSAAPHAFDKAPVADGRRALENIALFIVERISEPMDGTKL